MKLNRLETHDRYEHLIKEQSINIFQGADDCLKKNLLSLSLQDKCPYVYLYAHPRTLEDGATKVMYWQPRLTKPKPETNSYLFRAQSKTDIIEICWLIPPREMWDQYITGNITESDTVSWSISQFRYNKEKLGLDHPDDFPDHKIKEIYQSLKGIDQPIKLGICE